MNKLHIFTNAFTNHSCLNSPPKKFEWVFNKHPLNNEPVVYFDDAIYHHVDYPYHGPKYGWIGESSEIIHSLLFAIEKNLDKYKSKYKKIFTNDRRFIELDPSFLEYCPPASNRPWVKDCMIYEKNKLCSFITSFKSQTTGHVKRLMMFRFLKDKEMFDGHIFGRDFNPIKEKTDGLKDYMFSLAIENSIYPKYYTEKITDCFATGTVPIYFGDKTICEDFDKDGIIFLDELKSFDDLNQEMYINMLPAIKTNYDRVMKLESADDFLYERIVNDQTLH